ncbi:MAG TPA: hypothetical protein VNH16_02340 [Burkholderiales bacterium]|nr:hypothetical protein [Burkholderiales bacterium]
MINSRRHCRVCVVLQQQHSRLGRYRTVMVATTGGAARYFVKLDARVRIKDGAALSRARSARLERDHAGVVDGQQSCFASHFRLFRSRNKRLLFAKTSWCFLNWRVWMLTRASATNQENE